jgi:hypothetical protein
MGETYKVLHGALVGAKHHRGVVIGHLALGLGVDTHEVELLPTTIPTLSVSAMPDLQKGGITHIISINSSIFHACSELIGTEFGMRYSRSSSSMLMLSILLRT